jgi:hypothetical protein
MEVVVEISSRITAATTDPMEDLGSLRATCSQMRRVCGDAIVGRIIPLQRVLLRGMQCGTWKWFYDHEYHAKLIARLASVGNLEACSMLGCAPSSWKAMAHSCRGLICLGALPWQAMMLLHLLSLVLHMSNSGAGNDNIVRRLFRKVKGDEVGAVADVTWKNKKCTWCLQQAMWVLQDLARRPVPGESSPLPPLAMQVHRQDGHQC